jgi:hypothetical protein
LDSPDALTSGPGHGVNREFERLEWECGGPGTLGGEGGVDVDGVGPCLQSAIRRPFGFGAPLPGQEHEVARRPVLQQAPGPHGFWWTRQAAGLWPVKRLGSWLQRQRRWSAGAAGGVGASLGQKRRTRQHVRVHVVQQTITNPQLSCSLYRSFPPEGCSS